MELTLEDLMRIHQHSIFNEDRLKSIHRAGCFSCESILQIDEIKDWVDAPPNRTALCPHCGIDSVLAEDADLELSDALLKTMYEFFFGEPTEEEKENAKYYNFYRELLADQQENDDVRIPRILIIPFGDQIKKIEIFLI